MDNMDSDDDWDQEAAEEAADRLRKAEPAPVLSQDEFLAWRSPRQVTRHATRLDNPLWHWLVRTQWDAGTASEICAGPPACNAEPMWSFQRFGRSKTLLPGGQAIHIGGEHEDHYDPDFFIYNDVIVTDPEGGINIYGYPVEDFPPTDFHSATLTGNAIFIIGCLGHPEQRTLGNTPVYKLSLDSMHISPVETTGESPGWIYKHSASLANDGQSIIICGGKRWLGNDCVTSENIDTWSLNVLTGAWQRLTRHDWQRWTIRRVDRKPSRLWDVRQALWDRDHAHSAMESSWHYDDEPDFLALEMLYRLDDETPPPSEGPEFNNFSVVIDGLTVRFKEDRFWIEAIVEGQLAQDRLAALQSKTLALIERLEACACVIEEPGCSA